MPPALSRTSRWATKARADPSTRLAATERPSASMDVTMTAAAAAAGAARHRDGVGGPSAWRLSPLPYSGPGMNVRDRLMARGGGGEFNLSRVRPARTLRVQRKTAREVLRQ